MLSAQTQTLDQGAVTVDVNALEVIKHTTTVADHQQQTTTGVVIVLVLLEVLGQISDALGEQSNLDLRGAGVTLVGCVGLDDFLLFLSRKCTASSLYCCAVLPAQYRRALYPRAKHAKGTSYTTSGPKSPADISAPADGRSSRHAMDASRPPNNTTASATSSIAKNNRNEAQLRVRTLSFDSFLMHTSRPTQSTA